MIISPALLAFDVFRVLELGDWDVRLGGSFSAVDDRDGCSVDSPDARSVFECDGIEGSVPDEGDIANEEVIIGEDSLTDRLDKAGFEDARVEAVVDEEEDMLL